MPRKKKGPITSPVVLFVIIGCLLVIGPVMAFLGNNGKSITLESGRPRAAKSGRPPCPRFLAAHPS